MSLVTKFKFIILVLATTLTLPAFAGSGQGRIYSDWHIFGDGNLFFYLSGTHSDSPCSIPDRWAFDTTTAIGKAYYAAFLTAYAPGKQIAVYGSGTCTHGTTESVFDFHVVE